MPAGPNNRPPSAAHPVIVADNDAIIRDIVRTMLTEIRQVVQDAVNGDEAVAFAWKTRARLILLDLNMPGLNGLMACERIRAMRLHAATPIVILSGHHDHATRRAAKRAGATLFIAKPFQAAALLLRLSEFLDLDAATQEAVARGAQRAERITVTPPRPSVGPTAPGTLAKQQRPPPEPGYRDVTSLDVSRRLLS